MATWFHRWFINSSYNSSLPTRKISSFTVICLFIITKIKEWRSSQIKSTYHWSRQIPPTSHIPLPAISWKNLQILRILRIAWGHHVALWESYLKAWESRKATNLETKSFWIFLQISKLNSKNQEPSISRKPLVIRHDWKWPFLYIVDLPMKQLWFSTAM